MLETIRTLWGFASWRHCVECGHTHYNYEHHAYTQSCPTCDCWYYENLLGVFFTWGGLKGYRKHQEMLRRVDQFGVRETAQTQ